MARKKNYDVHQTVYENLPVGARGYQSICPVGNCQDRFIIFGEADEINMKEHERSCNGRPRSSRDSS